MVDDEEYFSKNFYLSERQLKFLDTINNNSSLALRTVLDSIIKGEQQKRIMEKLDRLLIQISLGFIMILTAYLMTDVYIFIITFSIGMGILVYSITRGVIDAIQIQKNR